jgi:hypothetical protein
MVAFPPVQSHRTPTCRQTDPRTSLGCSVHSSKKGIGYPTGKLELFVTIAVSGKIGITGPSGKGRNFGSIFVCSCLTLPSNPKKFIRRNEMDDSGLIQWFWRIENRVPHWKDKCDQPRNATIPPFDDAYGEIQRHLYIRCQPKTGAVLARPAMFRAFSCFLWRKEFACFR